MDRDRGTEGNKRDLERGGLEKGLAERGKTERTGELKRQGERFTFNF